MDNHYSRIRALGFLAMAGLTACGSGTDQADAYGNFEATEVIISAEASGQLRQLNIREGQHLSVGDTVATIDCADLMLQKAQAEANLQSLEDQTIDYAPEAEVYRSRLSARNKSLEALYAQRQVLKVEQTRIQNLMQDEAIPAMKMDEINGKLAVLDREIAAAESDRDVIKQQITSLKLSTSDKNRGILSAQQPLEKQVDLIEDRLDKCTIQNPVSGVVLVTYAEEYEFMTKGKPVYKIADLRTMKLRVYLGARQLPEVEIGQTVEVRIDGAGGIQAYPGKITWIASEAEFTPKVIQTREERVNLVYAVIVEVENDGALKIGMPGELWLTNKDRNESN